MNTDVIADMLTRMRNALRAGHTSTICPYSTMKENILKVLKSKTFIKSYSVETDGKFKELKIVFSDKEILNFKRVSKPGQRIYLASEEIKSVMNGYGLSVISTSDGVMAGFEAYKKGIGGELLCEVY